MPRQSPFTDDYSLNTSFVEETTKASQVRLFRLVTVDLPSPEPQLRIADSNYDITFGGIVYTKFPFTYNGVEVTTDGSISKASITISNVQRQLMYYIEQYDGLRGCRVSVKSVYASALDFVYETQTDGTVTTTPNPTANDSAYLEDDSIIDVYGANDQTVMFQMDPIIDLEIRLPRRRYMVDSCYWTTYGDPHSCKANLTAFPTPCNKTFMECKLRGNETNFGGFPGISGTRRILL